MKTLYDFIIKKSLFLLLMALSVNSVAQDSLEIFIDVDNWSRNKITVTDILQKRGYETNTFPNAYRRLTKCCCRGFQQKKIILLRDSGKYLIGDTVRLNIETKSVLSPFIHNYMLEFIIEDEKYLLVYIDRKFPFRTKFGYNMVIRKQLGCF